MTAQVIDRDKLGMLTKIGQGGQGAVYHAPNVKTKFAALMVYKEYRTQARTDIDFTALAAMPAWLNKQLIDRAIDPRRFGASALTPATMADRVHQLLMWAVLLLGTVIVSGTGRFGGASPASVNAPSQYLPAPFSLTSMVKSGTAAPARST